jgi:hypothetical protein
MHDIAKPGFLLKWNDSLFVYLLDNADSLPLHPHKVESLYVM